MNKQISIIAAVSQNGVIGKDNTIPWNQKADMKRFRELTTGHPLIMGRKTFESIGRPLPNRTNIVVTQNLQWVAEGCISVQSVKQGLSVAQELDTDEIFIVGGAKVYEVGLAYANVIYLTRIEAHIEGDVYFPTVRWHLCRQVSQETYPADDKNDYPYTFYVYDNI
jgi:dihydrofolate reductase